ncbi:hypothetical protein DAPPUDRAFT_322995 [Daphnia pulex]|uniref:Macoilin n=1 Tax=Daphnia pulex TaxID=6669 RepID=E9GXK8_DAPPU|nr:hypothetical protein DAPPUDRAFT_322995 [Daphnia pulex]|eukprot:EFX75672.1 hypothetical protein DAPPUDRAFT_322995 [Daphnia pulex]
MSFWAFVLIIDFLLEFRLELLWPLWLFLTSVYDSFKYQGLAFSVFFVCLSLTADFLCFLFIPVQWLFFVAPTYVWIQYVWHTERGICLPTICLWVLFIYVEASIRLKDLKHFPAHLDLCRPFAAHCIGYPVVTWGFDIKGYISYRIRQRKQREVAKENEFYYELLVQSLPSEQQEAYHLRNSASQQTVSNTVEELTLPVANGNPITIAPNAPSKNRNNIHSNSSNEAGSPATPSEHVLRLEADIKRLKADLQASRQSEAELRSQLSQHASGERAIRAELSQVQQDNDSLQAKLHGLVSARQSDKQTLASLEKRLQEERRCRLLVETQLANERRARANEVIEASKAQQRSKNNNGITECGEHCRQRRRELEGEAQQLRREIKSGEDRLRAMEMEIQQYQQLRRAQQETELLVSALSALQDKTSHLESSLSAETRIKLDLFSALGEAKKQLEQRESLLMAREREISELKAKVTEVLAVMPSPVPSSALTPSSPLTPMRPYTSKLFSTHSNGGSNMLNSCMGMGSLNDDGKGPKSGGLSSGLDPNATAYTPKALGNGDL